MKILYLDCGMGAAGDMLTAAVAGLLPDPDAFIKKLNSAGIPGVMTDLRESVKCGITGLHFSVFVDGDEVWEHRHGLHDDGHHHEHHHDHHHGGVMHRITHTVEDFEGVSDKVKKDILGVYSILAQAESSVHGVPVEEIHFHEIGTADALADITAACLAINELAPDEIVVSPVRTGFGKVKCAHGILPVPAPAAARILEGIPTYAGDIEGELCTPTGAALLKYFATRFENQPLMKAEKTAYGAGAKDFPAANCVRAVIGETENTAQTVCEISFNVDDMTAEETGFACEALLEGGALEVFTLPAGMKKSRPGTMITVLCAPADRDKILSLIFRHTSTIGVRETAVKRYVLDRRTVTLDTPYGEVRKKVSSGYGVTKEKYEYEDLARIAKDRGISLREAQALIEKENG
ncbi:MAG: nickel pincer cofactor biosynthesis protein LarC [Clostridia bacterium]|nr:nickel pincer cofactor biosynthesis protein LarC [Clostridia bacterium]